MGPSKDLLTSSAHLLGPNPRRRKEVCSEELGDTIDGMCFHHREIISLERRMVMKTPSGSSNVTSQKHL